MHCWPGCKHRCHRVVEVPAASRALASAADSSPSTNAPRGVPDLPPTVPGRPRVRAHSAATRDAKLRVFVFRKVVLRSPPVSGAPRVTAAG